MVEQMCQLERQLAHLELDSLRVASGKKDHKGHCGKQIPVVSSLSTVSSWIDADSHKSQPPVQQLSPGSTHRNVPAVDVDNPVPKQPDDSADKEAAILGYPSQGPSSGILSGLHISTDSQLMWPWLRN